jgi:hypothetical protein
MQDDEFIQRQLQGLQVNRRIIEMDLESLTDEYWQGKAETNYDNLIEYAENVDGVEPGNVEELLDNEEYDQAYQKLT